MSPRSVLLALGLACPVALAGPPAATAPRHELRGEVLGPGPRPGTLLLHHQEIPGVMPAMTMAFTVPPADAALPPGRRIIGRMFEAAPGDFHLEKIRTDPAGAPEEPRAFADTGAAAPTFTLVDQHGRTVDAAVLRGRPVVVNFIYTRCPVETMCPAATARMLALQRRAHERAIAPLELVSITLDPAHDTPAVLRAYAEARGADPRNFRFLTGPEPAVRRLLAEFGVIAEPGENLWRHTLATLLIGPDGRVSHRVEGSSWDPEDFLRRLAPASPNR